MDIVDIKGVYGVMGPYVYYVDGHQLPPDKCDYVTHRIRFYFFIPVVV